METSTQNDVQDKAQEIQDLALKLGFYPEIVNNKVIIYNGEEELFEFQTDTSRFIRKGYTDYVTKLNPHTYKAYIKKCLTNESKKLNKSEKSENKARFTSCQYGNKAWAVYDNEAGRMVAHFRSDGIADRKVNDLTILLSSKPDIIKSLQSKPENSEKPIEEIENIVDDMIAVTYKLAKKMERDGGKPDLNSLLLSLI